MGKSTNFSGQPIFNQLIKFIDKSEIRKIARHHSAERYIKKFSTYNHVIVMLFVAFEGYHSIREAILGLLANSHKLSHSGLSYLVRRSTFSEANQRRSSKVFGDIYISVYRHHVSNLADSRLSDADLKRLYIMDSTTISLFKDTLRGVGRNPIEGKKKVRKKPIPSSRPARMYPVWFDIVKRPGTTTYFSRRFSTWQQVQ